MTEEEFGRLAKQGKGCRELEPFRVDNAVIMAAGMGSRFAPLSYVKPKGLWQVKGEILIERQIRQLQEAGIKNIIVVVGYMKEQFFYLEEKFGVRLVINNDYYRYNNTSSLMAVKDFLANTYVCSSDNYFSENVFSEYVFDSFYAAEYAEGETKEYCLKTDDDDVITGVEIGGADAWYMIGHAYFSREFSRKFCDLLEKEYYKEKVKNELWENFYRDYIDRLPMHIKRYRRGIIYEFDSLEELREFDSTYISNTGIPIMENICKVLSCEERDITNIEVLKQGMTNLSFVFTCMGKRYVYRHPGKGTEIYISRESEAFSMQAAKQLGLDRSFLYMDPEEGWKISRFIEGAVTLDYNNRVQVKLALQLLRRLHGAKLHSLHDFDNWQTTLASVKELQAGYSLPVDFSSMLENNRRLYACMSEDGEERQLCHVDTLSGNFLFSPDGSVDLIDWEYSGNDDPGNDIGTFICCSPYDYKQALEVIELYLGRKPEKKELRHYIGCTAMCSFCWYVWAIYQEKLGKPVGEYLYLWYKYSKMYTEKALQLYEQ